MCHLPRFSVAAVCCATVFLVFSPAPAQQSAQIKEPTPKGPTTDEPTLKSDVNLVSVYFTVRDSHKRLIDDLDQQQFQVREDGRLQTIKFFSHHSDVPLNVGVLLDTGTSTASTLAFEADATSMFVQRVVRPTDLAFLVSYANRIETLQVPTSDVALLKEQAQTIRSTGPVEVSLPGEPIAFPDPRIQMPGAPMPGGQIPGVPNARLPIPGIPSTGVPSIRRIRDRPARLYDSVRFSIFHFLKQQAGRKALLIVALSDDQHSESTLEDALIALQQNDVIAYVVQVTDGPHDNCDIFHIFSEGKLRKLAEDTGGRLIEAHGMNKIADAFDQISEELHHQYSLGYYPENTNWDGRFRKIEIVPADHRDLVTARKGYYAIPQR
jgi:VWFA-related protein